VTAARYCCFLCPQSDFSEKEITSTCPKCGRRYDFPLVLPPKNIGDYTIERAIARGFYASTYVAKRGVLLSRRVLKVCPTSFYTFFNKASFAQEARSHEAAAVNALHIAQIRDVFQSNVIFGDGTTIECNIIELEYVDGDSLEKFTSGQVSIDSATVAQIAIDLVRMRGEFEAKNLNHNDLHQGNIIIERLPSHTRRAGAIKDDLRVKAIDLGSVSDQSKSDSDRERPGDLRWIANHIQMMINALLSRSQSISDRDYRVALALDSVINTICSEPQNIRASGPEDLVTITQNAYAHALWDWKPWASPFELRKFGEHYNAQTLDSWHAPKLHVDPDGRWVRGVTIPGPQVITGMRGCGKTLLLRSLEFHARAVRHRPSESISEIKARISTDGYVGLFVSAQRLLDLKEMSFWSIERAVARLFIHYAIKAIHSIIHLRDIDFEIISVSAHLTLYSVIQTALDMTDPLVAPTSIEDLEKSLSALALRASRIDSTVTIKIAPATLFPSLAIAIRQCSPIWSSSVVFYLLDDVSTRYLALDKIAHILTSLMFSDPNCAFKFTSEWQTIELGLKSPGRQHPVRIDRELSVFDLGGEVYRLISERSKTSGKYFVEKMLRQRSANISSDVSAIPPKVFLGDVALEDIAKEIAQARSTGSERKNVYRGLSAITHVCVGDLGDIIKLYEEILNRRSPDKPLPVPQAIQSECFCELSARRLYDLNRRAGRYKDCAKTFAEASHELLVRSARDATSDAPSRLRQYSSIYVRINTEDPGRRQTQIDQLRELIDAGVFVFSGGGPRTKTKDSDPILQFKLSYRKIYGLASFIGLSERDRFELSGPDLEEWLENPSKGKDILLRNLGGVDPDGSSANDDLTPAEPSPTHVQQPVQETVWLHTIGIQDVNSADTKRLITPSQINCEIHSRAENDFQVEPSSGILTGLGFEDRTEYSNKVLASLLPPTQVYAVSYDIEGRAGEIESAWIKNGSSITKISNTSMFGGFPDLGETGIVDISGLSKPFIFTAVRSQLMKYRKVKIVYTSASIYYPLKNEIQSILEAEKEKNIAALLDRLSAVIRGESGPYEIVRLLEGDVDELRKRSLVAFSSPKHERIMSLLDQREYDCIEIISPSENSPRDIIARHTAELIKQSYTNVTTENISAKNLIEMVRQCDDCYTRHYLHAGANVELGLTGNKLQAVAAAILSSERRISQAWYVRPSAFDYTKFTSGVGELTSYTIKIR